jgi:ABC-type uncharacterized transport system involved in gliding motility auxiliary subunit
MTPRAPPGAGSSELKKLFNFWGIEFDENKFVGDRTRAIRVQAPVKGRDVIADYLSWGIYDKRAMNANDIVTSQLTSISLASAGSINLAEKSKLTMTPLLQTSKISQRIDAEFVRGEINPEAILKQFKSENRNFTIAARFNGKVKSCLSASSPSSTNPSRSGSESFLLNL